MLLRAVAGQLLRCHAYIDKLRLVVRAGAVVVLKGHGAGRAIGRILVEPVLPECLRCAEETDSTSSKSAMATCAQLELSVACRLACMNPHIQAKGRDHSVDIDEEGDAGQVDNTCLRVKVHWLGGTWEGGVIVHQDGAVSAVRPACQQPAQAS